MGLESLRSPRDRAKLNDFINYELYTCKLLFKFRSV